MDFETFTDELWTRLCKFTSQLRLVFGLSVFFVLLLLVSLSITEPGTGTYVIIVVDIVTLVFVAILTGFIVRTCRKKA